jgi:hypothetical protein
MIISNPIMVLTRGWRSDGKGNHTVRKRFRFLVKMFGDRKRLWLHNNVDILNAVKFSL